MANPERETFIASRLNMADRLNRILEQNPDGDKVLVPGNGNQKPFMLPKSVILSARYEVWTDLVILGFSKDKAYRILGLTNPKTSERELVPSGKQS